ALVAPQREEVLHFLALGGLAALLGADEILFVLVLVDVGGDLIVVADVGNHRFQLGLFAFGQVLGLALFLAALPRLLRLLRRPLFLAPLDLGGGRLRLGGQLRQLLRRRRRRSHLLRLPRLRRSLADVMLFTCGCGLLVGHFGQLRWAAAIGEGRRVIDGTPYRP